jgi:TonB family protein
MQTRRHRRFLSLFLCLAAISVSAAAQDPNPTSPAAQVRLGNKYLDEKDYANAATWFRKAADHGNALAENNLGWLYQNGWGVKQDYAEAASWYRKSADQGNARAQSNLAWLYRKGLGVKLDYSEAMTWFRKSADQGFVKSYANIAWLYENGHGVDQDYAQAMTWYRKAADQDDDEGQFGVAWLYEKGLGVKQDYGEALNWYLKAAEKGNAKAQTNVGWFYQSGFGVTRDYVQAMAWFYRAADHDPQSQNNIGWLYENGLGVMPNETTAISWYRKAAAQGNAQAQGNLKRLSPNLTDDRQPPATAQSNAPAPAADPQNPPVVVLRNGVRAPRAIYQPDPEYSDDARKKMTNGVALLWLIVDTEGKPRDIKVVVPVGDGLDEKAVEAVKTWEFEPAMKDGKPVAVQINVEVAFRLYGSIVGKVDVVSDPQGANLNSYLSPLVREADNCWHKANGDTTLGSSMKSAQAIVQFAINKDGRVGAVQISSSSGDDILDRRARECVAPLKAGNRWPPDFKGTQLVVKMQMLQNDQGISIAPAYSQMALGGRKQFHLELAGISSPAAEWSVSGEGCSGSACGTISSDGLYTAPEVLPKPPFVSVKGTLAGANPMTKSATVVLIAPISSLSGPPSLCSPVPSLVGGVGLTSAF